MITITHGDIFKSKAECLVNAVNCIGVSGKGIALVFKRRFPRNQAFYETECELCNLAVGDFIPFYEGNLWVVNFATKFHYRDKSHLPDIKRGLLKLAEWVQQASVRSIAIPALGCGLGGLNWSDVLPLMKSAFADSSAEVLIYEPLFTQK